MQSLILQEITALLGVSRRFGTAWRPWEQGTVEVGQTASYYYTGKNPALAFDCCVPFGLTARQQAAWLEEGPSSPSPPLLLPPLPLPALAGPAGCTLLRGHRGGRLRRTGALSSA